MTLQQAREAGQQDPQYQEEGLLAIMKTPDGSYTYGREIISSQKQDEPQRVVERWGYDLLNGWRPIYL